MRIRFDEQLELLNRKLIEMGALCEDAISASMHTLKNETDKQSAEKVPRWSARSTTRSARSRACV